MSSSTFSLNSTGNSITACKICGGDSPLLGVVDFHKSCVEQKGVEPLPLSGIPIYYRRCKQCGFVFTDAFDTWSQEMFLKYIYNDDYIMVDPDFIEVRPVGNAQTVEQFLGGSRPQINILDYGGGTGRTAELLRERGFSATTYDPFSIHNEMPSGKFDLVICFEVAEHVPFPLQTMTSMKSFVNKGGGILFSTLLQPADFDQVKLNWWYAGPRNGHISLYSATSLGLLCESCNLKVVSFGGLVHFAYRKPPEFAAHLKLPA